MALEQGLSGPHVAAAFLCEKVLQERDGVVTFIRIVERFSVPVFPKQQGVPTGIMLPPFASVPPVQFNLVVFLKAGTVQTGEYHVSAKLHKPDGSVMFDNKFPVFFNGSDDNGVGVIAPVVLPNAEKGLYWFDIYFEENTLLTRIPMRVLHQPVQMQMPPHQ